MDIMDNCVLKIANKGQDGNNTYYVDEEELNKLVKETKLKLDNGITEYKGNILNMYYIAYKLAKEENPLYKDFGKYMLNKILKGNKNNE